MPSIKHQSAIESNNAFMVKIEDLVREVVIQNSIPYYRIESCMEIHPQTEGEDIYLPVIRVITYFEDTVNQISDLVRDEFNITLEKSIDKRKEGLETFSYKHVQYLASLKENRKELTEYKRSGNKKFEIQVCSMLQDAWSGIEKELGYDADNFPEGAKRDFYRVGALLEMADIEFCKIRSQLGKSSFNKFAHAGEINAVNESVASTETVNNSDVSENTITAQETEQIEAQTEVEEVVAQVEEPVVEVVIVPEILFAAHYVQTIVPKPAIPPSPFSLVPKRFKMPEEKAPSLIQISRVKAPEVEVTPQVKAPTPTPAPQVKAPQPAPQSIVAEPVVARQPAPQVKVAEPVVVAPPAPQVKVAESVVVAPPAPQVKVAEPVVVAPPAPQVKVAEPVVVASPAPQVKVQEPVAQVVSSVMNFEPVQPNIDNIKAEAIKANNIDYRQIVEEKASQVVNHTSQPVKTVNEAFSYLTLPPRVEEAPAASIPVPPPVAVVPPVVHVPPVTHAPEFTVPLYSNNTTLVSDPIPAKPASQVTMRVDTNNNVQFQPSYNAPAAPSSQTTMRVDTSNNVPYTPLPTIPAAPVVEAIQHASVNANGVYQEATTLIQDPIPTAPVQKVAEIVEQKAVPFFEDELDKPVPPSPLDENAPMTDATLRDYVLNSKLVKEVDQKIAERAGAKINNDIDIEGDVERLRFLKVFTLKQLHDRIVDNKNDIVAFAEKWIGKDNGGSFDSGICLFYLEYLLVGKKNDPAFSIEYVVKFISDNDYSARYIIPTYNSIRTTEVNNFAHLTLKA